MASLGSDEDELVVARGLPRPFVVVVSQEEEGGDK